MRNTSYQQGIAFIRTRLQWILLILFLAVLFVMPLFASNYLLRLVASVGILIIVVQGLNIVVGYCGQFSLAQSALMAVGAYISAIAVTTYGLSFWIALLLAAIATGVAGLVFGAPSLRVKGFYLALGTLAAHFIVIFLILRLHDITGGSLGVKAPRPILWQMSFSNTAYFYLIMLFTILATLLAKNIGRTSLGRAFIAIRDNEIAAETLGINLFRYKLAAFFLSAVYAGVAGSLWAHYTTHIGPDQFALTNMIWYLAMLIVGGLGSVLGPIFGVVFFTGIKELALFVGPVIGEAIPAISGTISASLGDIVFSVVLILFLVYEPRGLVHRWEMFKTSYRLWPFPR